MLPVEQIDLRWWLLRNGVPEAGRVTFENVHVQVQPLDDLGLAPAFIKVDVEGFELQVPGGLRRTIAQHRPVLFIERSADFVRVRTLLESLDYDCYIMMCDGAASCRWLS